MIPSPPHVQEMILPHFIDSWFHGTNEQVSIQVYQLTGLPVTFWVEEDGSIVFVECMPPGNS